jgi:hypothetical protein
VQKKLWSHWKSQRDYAKEKSNESWNARKAGRVDGRTDCTLQEK